MLIFDGHAVWFQAVDSEAQALAIYDYIDEMIAANRYLPPPAELEEFVFDGFAWNGPRFEEMSKLPPPVREVSLAERGFLFLTHADTDLLMLSRVINELPAEFRPIRAENLMSLRTPEQVNRFLNEVLPATQVVIVRLLGGKSSFEHGFQQLRARCLDEGKALLVLSGTDVPDPELTASSTVSVPVLHDAYSYFRAGGSANMAHLLRFLSDHLLTTGFGYNAPQAQPKHGIYHPRLNGDTSLQGWLTQANLSRPTVGILFYRSHWISGNSDFIDALIDEIEQRGGNALPVFTGSLKQTIERDGIKWPVAFEFFELPETSQVRGSAKPPLRTSEVPRTLPDVLISTMSFAMGGVNPDGPTLSDWSVAALDALDVPVLQAIASSTRYQSWQVSGRGLNPLDTAMNVALPEFDGRIITVPISFKGEVKRAAPSSVVGTNNGKKPSVNGKYTTLPTVKKTLDTTVTKYIPVPDRVERVIGLAMRFATLRRKQNAQKRVAFILTNSAGKASKIGNAVGLDAPASLMRLFEAMQAAGYSVEDVPEDGDALIHALIERCSYDTELLTEWQLEHAAGRVDEKTYREWFNELTEKQRGEMDRKWGAAPGEAFYHDGHLSFAGLELGNVFVALQPPRGYGMDPDAIYHTPDLAPPHHYHALYRWLSDPEGWAADAIVHVGKHGTLEWLPGKGVGLSNECFPDSFIADMPFFYPFILNNPGEGAQAKRRTHAVIIDHLVPPMMQADLYGELTELAQLVDEYYQLEATDPSKVPLLQQQIWELIQQARLDADMKAIMKAKQGTGEHEHEWDDSLTDDGTPVSLVEMRGKDVAHLMEDIDGYLCELQGLQIRDGLHILGYAPEGEQLVGLLQSLTRLPNLNIPSLRASIAAFLGFELDLLLDAPGRKLEAPTPSPEAPTPSPSPNFRGGELEAASPEAPSPNPEAPTPNPSPNNRGGELEAVAANNGELKALITASDAIEVVDTLCHELLTALQTDDFNSDCTQKAIELTVGAYQARQSRAQREEVIANLHETLTFVCEKLVPNIWRTDEEIGNLLRGLNGGYVPAGPSGAPTRGMAHVLPTGRNFYAVDPRTLPSMVAWRVGKQLAEELLQRYLVEEEQYPERVGLSIWGTSAMRTHGDDIAQVFALMGVRPRWQPANRRVVGVEVIPLAELGRPRIDVISRISGFFRDAFPHLIKLLDQATQLVAELDEPTEQNFVRKQYLDEMARQIAKGLPTDEARKKALYRIFGSKPGAYGAGILPLIDERNWENETDFAEAYVNWGGYAYTAAEYGTDARDEFRSALSTVQVAVKNQDNREHDIFDSDDYLQFHGGMIASIRALTGQAPKAYFGDNADPDRVRVRDLQEEAHRVFRSRVVNPKWIESITRHGYKGGLELAATVDYLFGYDATANVVEDWMYEKVTESYLLDEKMQQFFEQSNPWAMQTMSERLLEAMQRGLWAEPSEEMRESLLEMYLQSEGMVEEKMG